MKSKKGQYGLMPSYEEFMNILRVKFASYNGERNLIPKHKDYPKEWHKSPYVFYKNRGVKFSWKDLDKSRKAHISYIEYRRIISEIFKGYVGKKEDIPKHEDYPKNFPTNPRVYYKKKGFKFSWSDVFGMEEKEMPTYGKFCKIIRENFAAVQNVSQLVRNTKYPKDWSRKPDEYYRQKSGRFVWSDIFPNTPNVSSENSSIYKIVAFNVKTRMQNKGWNASIFSEIINSAESNVSNVVKGKRNLEIKTVEKYAKALGCEAWELLKPFELYKYGMRLRPFGIGCQPLGHVKYEDSEKRTTGLHGFIYYDRELTMQEVNRFELINLNK